MNHIEKKTLLFPRNIFDLTTLPNQPKTVQASVGKFRPRQNCMPDNNQAHLGAQNFSCANNFLHPQMLSKK